MNLAEEFGIKRELQDRGGFRFFGEFAVVGFVGPIAEAAWFSFYFAEDIGTAEKAAAEQGALRDRFDAGFHSASGFVEDALLVHAAEIDEITFADFLFEEFEVSGFVTEAEFLNNDHVGRFPFRDVALTASGGEFELGEVAARKVIAHVGGSQA